VETKAAVEIAQIAGEAGEIAGYAGVMFVMTLVVSASPIPLCT
jgi:hypothetical protein